MESRNNYASEIDHQSACDLGDELESTPVEGEGRPMHSRVGSRAGMNAQFDPMGRVAGPDGLLARVCFQSDSADELVNRAAKSYLECIPAAISLVDEKIRLAEQFDIAGMNRVTAIVHCGGSGSYLLATYLDDHPDIVMLPALMGLPIYAFLEAHAALSIWEKLLVYPEFSTLKCRSEGHFFQTPNPAGNFAISVESYYAAIEALYQIYGQHPAEWLNGRAGFFKLLHIAYTVALGRKSVSSQPLMVYAQHWYSDDLAQRLVEDFPDAQFLHPVRDPISGLDSWFDRKLGMLLWSCDDHPELLDSYFDEAVATAIDLIVNFWDVGHVGFAGRSRAVRFEDMHLAPEATMRRLAEWLGIAYDPVLVQSTWNGAPWEVTIRGKVWCGANPDNARRRHKNLNPADRALVYALQYDNFVTWNYPYPAAFDRRWLRIALVALVWILPMKMEIMNARVIFRRQVLPGLRLGRVAFSLKAPIFILKRRARMMWLVAREAITRFSGKRRPPTVLV
jgi:hypothetical protein